MNIKYLREMSDVHNEFGMLRVPELATDKETILLLCGDIHVGKGVFKYNWMQQLSEQFAWVVYILGNHEHYRSSIDRTGPKIKQSIIDFELKNVTLLENEVFAIPGTKIKIFGGTMWTDMNKGDPITLYMAQQNMNDYKLIRKMKHEYKFRPIDSTKEHLKFKEALLTAIKEDDGQSEWIVMSHHAPHALSGDPIYNDDYHGNGCYRSDLSELILDHPMIRYWFHGHMHNNANYMIGDFCNVINNPRGYTPDMLNWNFDGEFIMSLGINP